MKTNAIAILVTMLIGLWSWHNIARLNGIIHDNEETIAGLNAAITANKVLRDKELSDRKKYLEAIKEAKDENEKLHSCIADKSCVPRVYVKSTCPTTGTNNAGGIETTEAELTEEGKRAYQGLMDDLRVYDAMYDLCINTLKSWETKK